MAEAPIERTARGADALAATLRLAALVWCVLAVLQLALFARPSPFGGAYALDPWRYIPHALVYRALTVALLAAPFAAFWLWSYQAPLRLGSARRAHAALAALGCLVVMLDHADNELMRFMGTHLSVNLLRTYGAAGTLQTEVAAALLRDRGGPGSSLALLAITPLAMTWLAARAWRRALTPRVSWPRRRAAIALLLALAALLAFYNGPGGLFRRARVQGALLGLFQEAWRGKEIGERPSDYAALAAAQQARWLAENRAGGWRFVGGQNFPLLRAPLDPSLPEGERWNVIYLQLESFRGWNVGFLNAGERPSPTPFLDSLAASEHAAWWSRAQSFGAPTISGFMAGHCSIPPHSQLDLATVFTATRLDCWPAALRQHGWRTLVFTAADPDWDNERLWMQRWFDEIHYWPDAARRDRVVFRRAAARIREVAASGEPFAATIISITNHYPFESPEAQFAQDDSSDPRRAIRNTMRYTDDVVRELVSAFEREPWFARTLLIVAGDHAFNLGEHDAEAGQRNGHREAIWVPLLIAGAHPRLPRGRHDQPASLLDLAPTVSALLGVREPNAWLGHDLSATPAPDALVGAERERMGFAERGRLSLVVAPADGRAWLFDALADPLQRRDLAPRHPLEVRELTRAIEDQRRLVDYLIAADRVTPPPGHD